jgi:hypothetical protein
MMPPTDRLKLAEKWLKEIGNEVSPAEATNQQGETLPALQVKHGAVSVLVIDRNGVMTVLSVLQIPPELRLATQKLSNETQEQMLGVLRAALMDNPRTGWTLFPPTVTRVGDLQGIQMNQLFKIDGDQSAAFNRLADAMQEVVTMTVKVGSIFGGALRPGATLSMAKPSSDHGHDRIYG